MLTVLPGLHQAAHYDDPVAVRAMRPGLAGPPLELQLAAADLASGGKTGRPELLADQLSLIMEDTYASAQALSATGLARHARTLAESLLDVS